jgi:O-antigen/teichoic acid export membrane protein
MFPMVSAASIDDKSERARLARIFALSVRNLLLLLAPAVVLVSVFAPDVLRLWLGVEFANRSATALRVLAIGVMINGLSHVPCGYLQASGRPDIPARFHLLELVIHLPLTWFVVRTWGITGAALAWTIRVTIDAALLFLASDRVLGMSLAHAFHFHGRRVLIALLALVFVSLGVRSAHLHVVVAGILALAIFSLFAFLVWRFVLAHEERSAIRSAIGLVHRGRSKPSVPRPVVG